MGTTPYVVPDYQLINTIGDGHAGTVYRATKTNYSSNQQQVAVKVIPRNKVRDSTRREVALHITLHHPNIARLYRVAPAYPPSYKSNPISFHSQSSSLNSLAMVMELAPKGDMFTEVIQHQCLPPRILRSRLFDICHALQYLHQNRIVHHDLKLENVVIFNSSLAKLIDLGCARYMDPEEPVQIEHLGGTLQYLPPEVVTNTTIQSSPSLDAWALGVLIYTALVGSYPFNAATANTSQVEIDKATRRRIAHYSPHPIPSMIDIPDDLRTIMNGLLQKDPKKRMSISKVLSILKSSTHNSTYANCQVLSQNIIEPAGKHASCPTHRPRSPVSPDEADFEICKCDSIQTLEEAMQVVSTIQRNSIRAAAEVQKFMYDLEKSQDTKVKHDYEYHSSNGEIQSPQTSTNF